MVPSRLGSQIDTSREVTDTTSSVASGTPYVTPPEQAAPVTTKSGPTTVTAYVEDATSDTVSLDYIAIYTGDAAIERMISDGLCPASEPQKCRLEKGVYYRNTDPTIRTFPLSPNIEALTWTGTKYPLSNLKNRAPNNTPYSVTIDSDDVVIKIKGIYKP